MDDNKKRHPFSFPTDSEVSKNRSLGNKKIQSDKQKKYETCSKSYLLQQYTYQCHQYIKSIAKSAKKYVSKHIPIQSVIIAICKKLLLNQLQLLFLNCLIQQLKWEIMHQTIRNHSNSLKSLIFTDNSQSQQQKCVQLYLLLSAYAVKVYLNDDLKMFQVQTSQLHPKFQQVFQTWANKFAKNALSTNPKKLNKRYVQFTLKNDQKILKHQDYNKKVSQLLQNSEKNKQIQDYQYQRIYINNQKNAILNKQESIQEQPILLVRYDTSDFFPFQRHQSSDIFISIAQQQQHNGAFDYELGLKLSNSIKQQ